MKRCAAVLLSFLMILSLLQATSGVGIAGADETSRWIPVNNGLYGGAVWSLAIDPTNARVVYAGTDIGAFKSTNGGLAWTHVNAGLADTAVNSLVIDPRKTQVVYAAVTFTGKTFGGGVFKSTNGGSTWTQGSAGLPNVDVHSLAVDSTNTQIVYAGAHTGPHGEGGVYKSTDGGSTWTQTNAGLIYPYVDFLVIDPTNTQVIYAGTYNGQTVGGGVFKSTNGGTTWTQAGLGATIVRSLVIDPTNTQVIYAGTYDGVFKSTNGGSTWTQMNTGLANTVTDSVAVDPTNTQVVYAAGTYKGQTIGGGVFKSTNGGRSWTQLNTGLTNTNVNSLVIDPTKTATLYAGTFGGAFKSVPRTVVVLQIGKPTCTANGVSRTLDSPPVMKDARTLLPIRAIIEALGGTIVWNPTQKKVAVTLGGSIIELWIGKNTAKVNAVNTPIDPSNSRVVPEIINSRTMLPLGFVAENLGAAVAWDPSTQTITITYQGT